MTRHDLPDILYNAIKELGGRTNIIDVCKYVWEKHASELQTAGDLFYSWQYDIRWAATELRKAGRMKAADSSPRGIWEIL